MGKAGNDGSKDVEIMVLLKYLSKIWRSIEISLIDHEANLQLQWSASCFLVGGTIANQHLH